MTAPPPTLRGERVTLRPLAEEDVEWVADVIATPQVRRWWGHESLDRDANLKGLREHVAEATAFAIEVDGALAGWLGFHEETEPDYRSAGFDILLDGAHQDRGLGSEALRLALRWMIDERGHHRLTIDPDVDNARAIAAYERVGFKPVGVMRRYSRGADGEYHDGLLMDMLAEELDRPR